MSPPPLGSREQARQRRFDSVWTQQLDKIFADVAPYYDRANLVASLGLWNWILGRFMATIDVRSWQRVLDVCAGTNAVGIALLQREPGLEVLAIDRSAAMQEVGPDRAEARGFHIQSLIGDVHELPFPDNHFDVITLQYASRHLRIRRVFDEVHRVLRPGGCFYHCDMLRPRHPAAFLFALPRRRYYYRRVRDIFGPSRSTT
jgi:demethylmenaquinone methyltransferase / 2-methoxy-6-polyprenyl-1,4-benzoquinol methylase